MKAKTKIIKQFLLSFSTESGCNCQIVTTVYVLLYNCITLYSLECIFHIFSFDLPNDAARFSSHDWWKTAVWGSQWHHLLEVSQLLSDRAQTPPQVFWDTILRLWRTARPRIQIRGSEKHLRSARHGNEHFHICNMTNVTANLITAPPFIQQCLYGVEETAEGRWQ